MNLGTALDCRRGDNPCGSDPGAGSGGKSLDQVEKATKSFRSRKLRARARASTTAGGSSAFGRHPTGRPPREVPQSERMLTSTVANGSSPRNPLFFGANTRTALTDRSCPRHRTRSATDSRDEARALPVVASHNVAEMAILSSGPVSMSCLRVWVRRELAVDARIDGPRGDWLPKRAPITETDVDLDWPTGERSSSLGSCIDCSFGEHERPCLDAQGRNSPSGYELECRRACGCTPILVHSRRCWVFPLRGRAASRRLVAWRSASCLSWRRLFTATCEASNASVAESLPLTSGNGVKGSTRPPKAMGRGSLRTRKCALASSRCFKRGRQPLQKVVGEVEQLQVLEVPERARRRNDGDDGVVMKVELFKPPAVLQPDHPRDLVPVEPEALEQSVFLESLAVDPVDASAAQVQFGHQLALLDGHMLVETDETVHRRRLRPARPVELLLRSPPTGAAAHC
eukprot:scaffold61076_cov27-Tisochrysis_lutea.AAC.2